MADLNLTIALERYDRHVPLFMGAVKPPPGLTLRMLEVGMSHPCRDGVARHERFLRNNEFDIAETSLSSHVIATSRGAPFVGIPVFPRRLFSQNHIFVNTASGIEEPRDFVGRRVLIRSFQTTMTVLALGDLTFEYGVPWQKVRWVLASDEALPLGEREGVSVERAPAGADVSQLLIDGDVDGMIFPHPPAAVLAARDRVRPLFPDRKAAALSYYHKHGCYPIMHLIAFRRPVIEAHPWLARAIIGMWEEAKAHSREYYDDPGYAQLAFARNEFEAQEAEMGADPWPSGLAANRRNLEDFVRYSMDQRLIDKPVTAEQMFHEFDLEQLIGAKSKEGWMTSDVKRLGAGELKRQLHDGGEIALLDAREEGVFHARHLLLASCVPLGRLELLIDDLVPRRGARVVWSDDGDGSALRAARRMSGLGYTDVAVLDGGIAAWETAGYRLYSGVHVPSKAFAEVVEHEAGTPWISAPDLKALIDSGADIAIFDSRSYEEYHNNSIPTATSIPGAELVYRFADMVPSPDTTVIVNCGGRTRSIIGAQALRNAGFRNKIMSLKDGTMAWHLAGFEVVHGAMRRPPEVSEAGQRAAFEAASRVAARCEIPRIDKATLAAWRAEADRRTLYVLDVRTPEEYQAGHLAGARSASGGQLVQETDAHIATWNARVVLVDDNGVRATMTASWLKQIGWNDVAVLVADAPGGDWANGPHVPRVLGLDAAAAVASIEPAALRDRLAVGRTAVVDLDASRNYTRSHIPGAWFAIRTRLAEDLKKLPKAEAIVLTSPDGALARLAAADLSETAAAPVLVLAGGTEAWARAGLPLETGASHMASEPDDVVLSARERGQGREEAMREYLAWEIDLVNQMAEDDDQRFRVLAG